MNYLNTNFWKQGNFENLTLRLSVSFFVNKKYTYFERITVCSGIMTKNKKASIQNCFLEINVFILLFPKVGIGTIYTTSSSLINKTL